MKKLKKPKTTVGGLEDTIKAVRKANREAELEQNCGRWIAKDRPYKNKKKYDRKQSKAQIKELCSFSFQKKLVYLPY